MLLGSLEPTTWEFMLVWYKFMKHFAEGSSGSAGSQKLIQVHISLPCIGGSPLLDLSKKDRKPAQD